MRFADDIQFLNKYLALNILEEPSGAGKLAISGALQGRVMTSTSQGNSGLSYGWINRKLFESKEVSDHINVFGGEERFWLGPEGGQFSIFFKGGDPFDLEHWHTPRLIDLDTFQLARLSPTQAVYSKSASLTNYSGFTFEFDVLRTIDIFSTDKICILLGIENSSEVSSVGYQTTNSITNTGAKNWEKETGLLSIWLLGMFNPSPETTIIIPFHRGTEKELGPVVNDNYFGKVPSDRLIVGDNVIYFRGDGQFRSKIGLSPARAKDIIGAYDASNQILTLVKFEKPEGVDSYVNSLWELQKHPYEGDVINSYNDGPPEPGSAPLGPFYELETSSPALDLRVGQTGTHISQTFHFEGPKEALNKIATMHLGISLNELTNLWN